MPEPTPNPEPVVYQLHVVLRGVSPLIWRRLLVRSDNTIANLHATFQLALGWSDEHLNRLVMHGREYGVWHDGGIGSATIHVRCDWPTLDCVSASDFSMSTISRMAGSMTSASSSSCHSNPERHFPVCIGGRWRVPPEDCGGPWPFLELRQRYSMLNIADRLYELAERRLDMGSEAFVHDHYEDVLQLMRWLEIDRFDRRAINRRLAELAVAAVVSAAS